MPELTIGIKLGKNFENQIADTIMEDLIDEIFQLSQENLVKMKAIDTGFLLKSGNVNKTNGEWEIIYSAPYAGMVEYGRNPGSMPPVESLKKWVRRKLGIKGQKKINNVSWAIAQKIKTKGIKPRPFIRNALSEVFK